MSRQFSSCANISAIYLYLGFILWRPARERIWNGMLYIKFVEYIVTHWRLTLRWKLRAFRWYRAEWENEVLRGHFEGHKWGSALRVFQIHEITTPRLVADLVALWTRNRSCVSYSIIQSIEKYWSTKSIHGQLHHTRWVRRRADKYLVASITWFVGRVRFRSLGCILVSRTNLNFQIFRMIVTVSSRIFAWFATYNEQICRMLKSLNLLRWC